MDLEDNFQNLKVIEEASRVNWKEMAREAGVEECDAFNSLMGEKVQENKLVFQAFAQSIGQSALSVGWEGYITSQIAELTTKLHRDLEEQRTQLNQSRYA
jgi:hypothetical protein